MTVSGGAGVPGVDWPALIEGLSSRIAPRGKSLIMTVYGDSILPHGGGAWLGELIALLEPLGLNERVVRTSVYRLVQDDLLSARQIGRRSFYALTENGTRQSLEASRRIYSRRAPDFDGIWTQVWLPEARAGDARFELASALSRLGFGTLAPDVMLHHGDATKIASDTAARLGAAAETVILLAHARGPDGDATPAPERLARCWPLDTLAAEYHDFLDLAAAPIAALSGGPTPDPRACFYLRSLLVHAYRRIVLKDPMLPVPLLPVDWPGPRAERAMAGLYEVISGPAQTHVGDSMTGIEHSFGAPEPGFGSRFQA